MSKVARYGSTSNSGVKSGFTKVAAGPEAPKSYGTKSAYSSSSEAKAKRRSLRGHAKGRVGFGRGRSRRGRK
jgi:hypothetical protein